MSTGVALATPDDFAPVAVVSRSGFDESVHFGAVVGLASDGGLEVVVGNPLAAIYPRSANKPLQAVAMVRAGLRLPPEQLALVCASHDGTPRHLDLATRILADAGLGPADLGNTPSLPLNASAAQEVLRSGGGPSALAMNCSGKHAGMLATCVARGWVHGAEYLSAGHPLQQCITETIDELCGEPHSQLGIDGCGAPAHVMSLLGLARAFRSLASGAAGSAGDEVRAAMTAHPDLVGGDTRDVTVLMRHVSGLMAKDGAEGVFAAALPDGRAVALKVADGGDRARPAVMLAAMRALGIDTAAVAPLLVQQVMGHGHPVGAVRSIAP